MTLDAAGLAALAGVAVFALSGSLLAARKELDPLGFAMLAVVTGVGGGTLRDVVLGRRVFWVADPLQPAVCVAVAFLVFFAGRAVPSLVPALSSRRALLWADAAGLALFSVSGAAIALQAGAHPLTATVLGALTATFGGVIRDMLAGERSLLFSREIYVTAAFAGAAVYVVALQLDLARAPATWLGIAAAFALRALAMLRGWRLPAFPAR